MKFDNKLNSVKVGRIYFYDVAGLLSSLHNDTKTVKVLGLKPRRNSKPLATVQSVQTGEIFHCDIGHLQLDPQYLKRKYHSVMRFYKKNKPYLIFTPTIFRRDGKYVIIGNAPEINCLVLLDKNGVLHDFGYDWFENFNLVRNASYDYEQEHYAHMMKRWYGNAV